MSPHDLLQALRLGATLSEQEADDAFQSLLGGAWEEPQIAGFLSLLQARGVTVDELVGAARVMRRHVTRIPIDVPGAVIIDTCGTGGAPKTFNISTAAAIVCAAASPHRGGPGPRVLVAKHGNRSRSGRGSAEVLSRLGVDVDAPVAVQSRCLQEAGVCFCFAIHHHPAAKVVAGARRSLGIPTIFNLLGPLTNPAGATRQLIGIYDPQLVEKMASALARLGSDRAMVVHGHDGMDEISTTGPTCIAEVARGTVSVQELDATAMGLPRAAVEHLVARDLDHAVVMFTSVLSGERSPAREIVCLNAAAALFVAGAYPDISTAFQFAETAIDSGAARRTLDELARLSRERP
jgi:anthranilate phosphoribosyltransferase